MEHTNEREISLNNLFWKLLLGWRRWIAMGIVFAIVVSGFMYIREKTAYQAALKQQSGEAEETEEVTLTKEEMTELEDVRSLEKQISKVRKHLEESVYMNLKPDNTYALILQYYVDSDYTFNYAEDNKNDYTDAVTESYCSYAVSGALARAIQQALSLELEEGYINELISTECSANTFSIKVLYSDTETLEQMKSAITKAVESQTAKLVQEIGTHTLKLITENVSAETDASLTAQQKNLRDMLYAHITQLNGLKALMTEEQLAVLDQDVEEEEETEAEPTLEVEKLVPPSFNIIYAVLGFIVGAFLACIWLLLEVLFAARVQEAEEVSELYGIRTLGEVVNEDKKKKIFGGIDALLLKLKNHNKKQMTREQQIKIICSNIEIACRKEEIEKVYFTGSEIEKMDAELLSGIKAALSSSGIQVCSGENISYDAKSLKEMAEIGHVVFVEQVGLSLYKEIEKELKLAGENAIDIMGSIVIV